MIVTLKQIWNALTPAEKRKQQWLLTGSILLNITDVLTVAATLWMIDALLTGKNPSKRLLGVSKWAQMNPIACVFVLLLLLVIKNVMLQKNAASQYRFNYEVSLRLAEDHLFDSVANSYQDYIQTDSAAHIYRIAQQPVEFSQYLLASFQQIITQSSLVAITLIAIAVYNPFVLALLIVCLLPPVLFSGVFIKKKVTEIRRNNRIKSEKSLQHLKEFLNGYVEHYLFNSKRFMAGRYLHRQGELNVSLGDLQTVQLIPSRLFEVFAFSAIFIVILTSRATGGGAVGTLIPAEAFVAATYKIIPGLLKIITARGQINAYRYLLNDKGNRHIPDEEASDDKDVFQEIRVEDIFFKHREKLVFQNFSMSINAGEFIGLQAPSGKGKSTLINLLLGFYQPLKGKILWNDKPVNRTIARQIHRQVSYVKQQTLFIHDSLLKNITLSDEAPHLERLELALHISGTDQLVSQFPEGLQKIITENGSNLSGGQRQRIMLARALYKRFDLLILDEPFSELDELAEFEILNRLQQFTNDGKTIILITHNRRSLHFCNKIINLDETPSLSYS